METSRPRFLVSLLGLILLFFCASSPLSAQRNSKFMERFRTALSKNDRAQQDKLMKKNHTEAVMAIAETCQEIGRQSSATLEKEIAALIGSWERVHETNFANSQYKYFSLMKPTIRNARRNLIDRYLKLYAQYQEAVESKKGRAFGAFGSDFEAMSKNFEDMGDLFMASVTAEAYAYCFDSNLNGDQADLRRACEGYGRVVALRERLGLFGETYKRSKGAFDELEFKGYGDPEKGPEGRKKAKAKLDPSYRLAELELKFELAPDFKEVVRPNYFADDIYQVWHTLNLKRVGGSGKINQLGELSPQVLRQAAVKVAVDSDGDGTGDTPIEVNGNLSSVQFSVGEGEAKREWALQAITGSNTDTVQGIRPFNLASDELNMAIYIAPAASMVGTIDGTRIQIIDDNMDGRYGSDALAWGLWGMRQGDNQLEVDSMLIGNSKRALPWSERVKIGDAWYALFPKEDGSGISYSKVDLETGTLKLDMKGLKPDYILVQGTGNNRAFYFDIAGSKKGVEVPAGTYAFVAGMVSKGKKGQKAKAFIHASTSMPLIKVRPGGTETLKLGAPYGFDFSFTQNQKVVTVPGESIVVTGRGGETYQRLWNCRVQPEVSLRKEGSRKGSKGDKMRLATDQNELTEAGYGVLWFPYDKVLPKSGSDKMEVQLYEKKNKLFGKITSDWKKEE